MAQTNIVVVKDGEGKILGTFTSKSKAVELLGLKKNAVRFKPVPCEYSTNGKTYLFDRYPINEISDN